MSAPAKPARIGTGRSRPGFTLIELMVVIAIISMLAGMLLPSLSAARERARRTDCLNNMRQMAVGLQMYSDNYGGIVPGNVSMSDLCSNRLSEEGRGPTDLGLIVQAGYIPPSSWKMFWCRNERNNPNQPPTGWGSWPNKTCIGSYIKSGSRMDMVADPKKSISVSYVWDDPSNYGKALLTESKANHGDGVNVFYANTYATKYVLVPSHVPDVLMDPEQFYARIRD